MSGSVRKSVVSSSLDTVDDRHIGSSFASSSWKGQYAKATELTWNISQIFFDGNFIVVFVCYLFCLMMFLFC